MAFLCGGGMVGSSLEAARQTAELDRDPTVPRLGPLHLVHFTCPARNARSTWAALP